MKYILTLCAVLLWSCAPGPLLSDDKLAVYDPELNKWERYGAYYKLDEVHYKAIQKSKSGYTWPGTIIKIRKKIKILSKDGMRYGSVPVPEYSGSIRGFRLKLTDPDGKEIPLNTSKLLRNYKEHGIIDFPKVTPGCMIEIEIKWDIDGYYYGFEHWMSKEIPVLNARFALSVNRRIYKFDYKHYGDIPEPDTTWPRSRKVPLVVWTKQNVLPRNEMDYRNYIDTEEPRICLAYRAAPESVKLYDWKSHSKKYEKILMKTSIFKSTYKLKKRVNEIKEKYQAGYAQADAFLHWVQKNISYKHSKYGKINPDQVIHKGRGNVWEIVTVLKEIFNFAGYQSDVIITRPVSMGSFDPTFPGFENLWMPMVKVKVENRGYIAFPFSNTYKLGEYPSEYFGLSGLSLTERDVVKLPDSEKNECVTNRLIALDVSQDEPLLKDSIEYRGYAALDLRYKLLNDDDLKPEAYFDTVYADTDPENKVKKFRLDNLEQRGEPMKVSCSYTNGSLVIPRKGKKQYRFTPIFPEYFYSYDTSRVSTFQTRHPRKIVSALTVANPGGKQLSHKFECEDLDNPLFSTKCSAEERPPGLVLKRTINIKHVNLSANEMRKIHPDILAMNRIRDSYVTVE